MLDHMFRWCMALAVLAFLIYGSLMTAWAFSWAVFARDYMAATVFLISSATLGLVGIALFRVILGRRALSGWLAASLLIPGFITLLIALP